MRTLTIESWILRNRFANFIGGERRYNVSGAIAFEFGWHTTEPDLAQLAEAIREVDRTFPWHDDIHPDAREFESICYLSDGRIFVQDIYPRRKVVWFSIYPTPQGGMLRKAQVYAYEKYLAKLAEELAKKKLSGIAEVRSVIEVRAATRFRAA